VADRGEKKKKSIHREEWEEWKEKGEVRPLLTYIIGREKREEEKINAGSATSRKGKKKGGCVSVLF